jgi:hypothetical protein
MFKTRFLLFSFLTVMIMLVVGFSPVKAQSPDSLITSSYSPLEASGAGKANPQSMNSVIPDRRFYQHSFWKFRMGGLRTIQPNIKEQFLGFSAGIQREIRVDKLLHFSLGGTLVQQEVFTTKSNRVFSRSQRKMVNVEQQIDSRMLYLDIPLNVSVNFYLGSIQTAVKAGVSNLIFLNEQVSRNDFQDGEFIRTVNYQFGAFEHFDLVGMLNFGFSMDLLQLNRMVIGLEPEVRYPLRELSSERVEFGSYGLNLTARF